MYILLTGATGFVGSHVLKALIDDGHTLCIVKRSYSSTERIDELLSQCVVYNLDEMTISQIYEEISIDCIIHCATYYGRNDRECIKSIESNLLFPLELLSIGKKNGVKFFINTDSFFTDQIITEQDLDKELCMHGYTLSKTQFRQWGRMFAANYGMQFINMKLEHVYGEKDDESKFIPYVLNECVRNVPKVPLTLGIQRRDFIHISDVVNAYRIVVASLGKKPATGYISYEVGTGKDRTLREFIEIIHEAVGSTSVLEWGAIPMKNGEVQSSKANNMELKKIGWSPKIVERKEIEQVFGWGGEKLFNSTMSHGHLERRCS